METAGKTRYFGDLAQKVVRPDRSNADHDTKKVGQ